MQDMIFLYTIRDVQRMLSLSRSSIYGKLSSNGAYADSTFPKPIHLSGSRAVRWIKSELDDWLTAQIEKSRQTTASIKALAANNTDIRLSNEHGAIHG